MTAGRPQATRDGHLLITGFGPFPGMPRNPSAVLARRLAGLPRLRRSLRVPPRCLVLETAYAAIPGMLEPALAERPAAILMFGVAGRARRMRVEARATNRASRLYPDAAGRAAGRLALDPAGPAARTCPAAIRARILLRRAGLDVGASREAGRYLCNASYYRALAEPCPVLFLHIPPRRTKGRPVAVRRRTDPDLALRAFAELATCLAKRLAGGHRL